jgi:hypothetical protein
LHLLALDYSDELQQWISAKAVRTGNRAALCFLDIIFFSLTELAAHLQKNMNIGLPDGRTALLRFQDPRVQVRLATMLNDLHTRS